VYSSAQTACVRKNPRAIRADPGLPKFLNTVEKGRAAEGLS